MYDIERNKQPWIEEIRKWNNTANALREGKKHRDQIKKKLVKHKEKSVKNETDGYDQYVFTDKNRRFSKEIHFK